MTTTFEKFTPSEALKNSEFVDYVVNFMKINHAEIVESKDFMKINSIVETLVKEKQGIQIFSIISKLMYS